MKRKPKITLVWNLGSLFLSLFLFTGCSSFMNGASEPYQPDFEGTWHQNESFSMYLPKEWEQIKELSAGIPQETIAAFRTAKKTNGMRPNITITKIILKKKQNSTELMQTKNEKHAKTLKEFKLISEDKIELLNNQNYDETLLILFSGKQNQGDTIFTFLQTGLVGENHEYLITATMPDNMTKKEIRTMEEILKSFFLGQGQILKE